MAGADRPGAGVVGSGAGLVRQDHSEEWAQTVETNLKNLLDDVIAAIQTGLVATVRTVSSTISFVIGLVVIPFWLFYILHDQSQVAKGVLRALPQQLRPDVQCMIRLIDDVLSAYIRGQLLLCLFVGGMATIAMFIIGVPFALVLGIIAGFLEVLPFIGPILGAIRPAGRPALRPGVGHLGGHLLFCHPTGREHDPGASHRRQKCQLHPALVMVVLVIGNEVAGLFGMLLAVP